MARLTPYAKRGTETAMVHLQVRLPRELLERIRERALLMSKQTGLSVSQSDIVRLALLEFLANADAKDLAA